MKIVVVGDTLVSSDTIIDSIKMINFPEKKTGDNKLDIKVFEWHSGLKKEQFQEKILLIESKGSEGVDIPEGILDEIEDADYLFVHIAPVSKLMIEKAKKLKLVATCRGGLEHVAIDALKEKNIKLIHVIRNAEPVADFTIGLMYAETRNIARSYYAVKNGNWRKGFSNDPYKTVLANLTVGIVGLGYIGKLVVKRLNALGINVIAYDPFVDKNKIQKEGLIVEFLDFEYVIKQADILSLHMRLTPQTEKMINRDVFNQMKPSSYIINTARAGVIDKTDLVEALQNKSIAGAALDVSWVEPIAEGDILLELDNITLTSHIAGDTIDAIPRSPYLLKNVLNDYFSIGFSDMEVKY